jgi:hypothetical protein
MWQEKNIQVLMDILEAEPNYDGDEPLLANRFDFALNNNYYILNL